MTPDDRKAIGEAALGIMRRLDALPQPHRAIAFQLVAALLGAENIEAQQTVQQAHAEQARQAALRRRPHLVEPGEILDEPS